MLSRMKFEIEPVVTALLDQLPESVWTSETTRFFDPAVGGGQFVREIEHRLQAQGHSAENISQRVMGFEESELHIRYAVNRHGLVGRYQRRSYDQVLAWQDPDRFDVIVGNPPYQDRDKNGGQNKIYNQFARHALDLLSPTGCIAFITPTTVVRRSKRFSLVGQPGLKHVDFTADQHFPRVGINVCGWVIDRGHSGPVTVVSHQGSETFPAGSAIHDPSEFSHEFMAIYQGLKDAAQDPADRMFKQNPVDTSTGGRSLTQTKQHRYPVFKIGAQGEELVQYNRPQPKLHGKKKFVVSVTKAFTENSCLISRSDFDVNHVFTEISGQREAHNIKTFLFSEYFVRHVSEVKRLDGYGFNNALKYLPVFDKTKSWTNDEVRGFIESFALPARR